MKDDSLEHRIDASEETANDQSVAVKQTGHYENLVELVEVGYKNYAQNIAVTNMGVSLTYAQLAVLSTHFASYLQNSLNIQKGDRVAIMMPNCLQYYVAIHGILRAGAVIVNINPLYTPRELAYQLTNAKCQHIILSTTAAAHLAEILSSTPVKNIILTNLGDMLGLIKGCLINFAIKYIKHAVRKFILPNAVYFKTALAKGKKQVFKKVNISANDMAFLQYTGGTTGVSKGAILTHANMCANVWQARSWAKTELAGYAQLALSPLPLYHIFSLTITAFCVYTVGGHVLLVTDPRNIPSLVKLFKNNAITMITGLNTLYAGLLRNNDFCQLDFSTLKLTISGGMGTREVVANEWQRVTKNCIIEGYGLTEASPIVCINPIDTKQFNGTIGKAVVNTVVEIHDDNGHALPVGEVGELCAKGPQVMKGYWENPEETAKVLTADGWLKTGDMCSIDSKGFVKLIDRKKELIVVSGFKVYPNEVEDVLTAHPGILEAAVTGAPDSNSGEHVKAYVVKKDPALTADDIMNYCREKLTGYKRPHEVEFRDSLPKSNVGKVLRRVLRDEQEPQS